MQNQSVRPQTLETSSDYRPALLWLMGELEQARTSDVIAEFDRRLGNLIPIRHRERNKSGDIRWEHNVRWARQDLVIAGLMGSGGHGIWTITEAGRRWLQDHPDGGKRELAALIRSSKLARKGQSRPAREPPLYTIRLAGETFKLSKANVLDAVRVVLTEGVPSEAKRFKSWFLSVDGKRLSVKWVMSLVTGLSTDRFTSDQARRQLKRLGLDAQSVKDASAVTAADTATGPDALTREAFYRAVLARSKGKLPAEVHNRGINPSANYLRLNHPAPRTHYELVLHQTCTDLGLVFYGPEAENRARLAPFEEARPDLEAQLGRSIQLHVGGESYTTVRLRLPPAQLNVTTAHQLADLWLRFIEVTLPLLNQVVAELGLTVSKRKLKDDDLQHRQAILIREITNIRAYLNGNWSLSPSDEKLCDWVQFCYTFELFAEAAALFKLVRPEAVHPWLYDRTQRLARACELRSHV